MSDVAVPTFSLAERDRRWELARGFMKREGLDALLVFGSTRTSGAPATSLVSRTTQAWRR